MNSETSASSPQLEETITEDGILSLIISSLPLREAVGTCVLSSRWRCIWTHICKLKFDAAMLDAPTRRLISRNSLLNWEEKCELLKEKTDQFIQSVDWVMHQCQGARLEVFLVNYNLRQIHSQHLDAWVHSAIKSKTKKLSLYLHKPIYNEAEGEAELDTETEPYAFPGHLLGSSFVEELALNSCNFKLPCTFKGICHLRQISFFYVDISEEDINNLLSNCYHLEQLSVWNSPQLVTLIIPRALSKFQCLFVKHCNQLREINIDSFNLSRLRYLGHPVNFIFSHTLLLKDAKIFYETEEWDPNLNFNLNKLLRKLPHVRSLTIQTSGVSKVDELPHGSCKFVNLTRLDWIWSASIKMSVPSLAALLDAAPVLEDLKLRLWTNLKGNKRHRVIEPAPRSLTTLKSTLPEHPRPHLRTIGIYHFCWDKWQIEIALYLLKNAFKLESITLQKGHDAFTETLEADIENLRQEVPANVKLLIM